MSGSKNNSIICGSRISQVMVTEDFVQIDGLRMRFQRCGEGPTVVLVHGLLGYSFSWRFILPRLDGRKVFAVDMLGSGLSDCSQNLDARLRAATDRLRRFLDAVEIEHCDLVGSSYGGATALMLAAIYPERLRTLTLVSPANPWSRIGTKRLTALKFGLIAGLFPSMARGFSPLDGYFIGRMYGDPRRLSQQTIEGYERALSRPGVFEHAVKIAQTWRSDMDELKNAIEDLPDIPTLIVWGDRDRVVDIASAQILASKIKRSQGVILPGLGHIPYEEGPDAFLPPLQRFLAENSPAGSAREVT